MTMQRSMEIKKIKRRKIERDTPIESNHSKVKFNKTSSSKFNYGAS